MKKTIWVLLAFLLLVVGATAIEQKIVYNNYEKNCEMGTREVWKEKTDYIYADCSKGGNASCVEGELLLVRSYNYKTTEQYCKEEKELIVGENKIDLKKDGCYVKGDLVTCIQRDSGYAINRNPKWHDVCRSGEKCYQYKLSTWEKTI